MNLEDLFISNMDEYKIYKDLINNVFKTSINLPENVFRDCYNNFLFEEFDWAMTEEFSEKLKQLAIETNEPFILTAVLEPNPYEYYFNEFGYFNWAKIPTDVIDDFYFEVLEHSPAESIADSILYNSRKIVWTVPSAKWAIWGDRDYGVCILGCKVGCNLKVDQILHDWKTVEIALKSWIMLSFTDQNIPSGFQTKMILNYNK